VTLNLDFKVTGLMPSTYCVRIADARSVCDG